MRNRGYSSSASKLFDSEGNLVLNGIYGKSGTFSSFKTLLGRHLRLSRQCSVFKAELWEILDGLLVLLSEGFKRITIQTDSSITMPTRFRRIMRTEEQWCVKYVLREFNQVADCLVKLSFVGKTSLQV
ncbi:hypothetical protein Gorai_014390 [Gossypium raimondii]|uniref:RNase H type-1 domain-containing protein n=1 Tax=Gossypium raimondii TaxID=29730 RepID=A0A7J8P317_GOSRA|nr:hypothetical protein [Gossypium raimondii]